MPSRGYEVGAKGWELVKGKAQSVIGWKVEVVYWNRAGEPRWHTGALGQSAIVIDHQRPQGEKELPCAGLFYDGSPRAHVCCG